MENLRKNLELIEVEYSEDKKKVVLTFLDEENGQVLEVNFNKQSYDSTKNQYYDDPEKEEKVNKWCKEYFDTAFDKLNGCIGVKKDVYAYDKFNSLFEVEQISKFNVEQKGEMISTVIEDVIVDEIAIRIRYKYDDNLYESKNE